MKTGPSIKKLVGMIVGGIFLLITIILVVCAFKKIPAGHVGVATLFGKVVSHPYEEGLHFTNPFYGWQLFDGRQKTIKDTAAVPSKDQLRTEIDISIQYRLIKEMAPNMLQETGSPDMVIDVHLMPLFRSVLREQGKTVDRAEEFFQPQVQTRLQSALADVLIPALQAKGIEIQQILFRDVRLPGFIAKAIESKKVREQEAMKQKAELERFKIEQEQIVAKAEAEKKAADVEAQKIRVLADAKAYEIQAINKAIANNPAYIKLMALKALEAISKDPASKLYFLNSDSPNPLPLMHLGDVNGKVIGK